MTPLILLCVAAAALLAGVVESKASPPQVQVYSSLPAKMGEENTLICLVREFHPPEITIELMSGNELIPKSNQTDLAFNKQWRFHLSRHAPFVPTKAGRYACRVTHSGRVMDYAWDPNM